MPDLKDLANKRKDILLAEVAAWLHDVQKATGKFLISQFGKCLPRKVRKALSGEDFAPDLAIRKTVVEICGEVQKISDLMKARNPNSLKPTDPWILQILGKCHVNAHMEKEKADGPSISFLSTGLGFEIKSLILSLVEKNSSFVKILNTVLTKSTIEPKKDFEIFRKIWGDTKEPINEVTLWDWSSIVAALNKAEIARCVLTGEQRQPQNIQWRLLSIRTDGLEYMLSAPSIPDLLAIKELLTDAWNRVQKLLEEEYPMGLEVYRDENGPVFVVPDLEYLLDLTNPADNNKTLREYILEAFRQGTVKEDPCLALDGEIVPVFILDSKPWKGQPAPDELPPIGEHLNHILPLQSDPAAIAPAWGHHTEEICSVCGLRPQGPDRKAKSRKMCAICEQRRSDRAKAWTEGTSLSSETRFKQGKPDTIWLDEVADKNGRLALIVGRFDLIHWLDGTLVCSLAVRTSNDQNGHTAEEVSKNPSYSRIRRIWETTRRFWQDVAPTDAPPKELMEFCNQNSLQLEDLWEGPLSLEASVAGKAISEKRSRLFLKAQNADQIKLGPFHAYELEVKGRKVAVLWVPPDATNDKDNALKYRGGFWVIENLDYLENVFGKPFDQVVQIGGTYEIYEPTEYGRPGRRATSFVLEKVVPLNKNYIPLIPILAEPQIFMALVPANKALEAIKTIKTKYEREMGKVRNRLPLHLGLVFADSHQPLRIILDAGRRMLRQKAEPLIWKVVCPARKQVEKGDYLLSSYREDQEKQFKEWYEILLESLEDKNRKLTWYVPAKMGDGQTEDFWYPFAFLKQKEEPKDREIYYQARNPWNEIHSWLVHVSKLQPGDIIYFTPASLDFIWLDHSGTRFEIAYNETGRRLGTLRHPYLLDEVEDLIQCWGTLNEGLSTRQIHQVRSLIETKRTEWFEDPQASIQDETFQKFCYGVLSNAEWNSSFKPDLKRLTYWAVTSLLADTVELHHHIMKQDGKQDIKGEGTP